jgi:CO/xanthine dehydrogenase Mo-binding subunit
MRSRGGRRLTEGTGAMSRRIATIDPAFFAAERDAEFHVIGTAAQRSDARGHVLGQTQYFEDVSYRGMTHLKMHRSTRHHALIKSVDTAPALDVPGVLRVLTWRDVPNNWYTILRLIGVQPDDEPVLAEDRVLYKGEPICAVVADSEAAAIEGASRIRVEYEDLPAVFDVEEALRPETIVVNPKHGHNYFTYEGHHCRRIRFGDVDTGFAEADQIFEFTYQSSPIEHAPLEPTGCIVKPEGDGRLKIHSDTQACYFTLDNTALTLGIPFNRLRVVGGTVGGGFGGKVDVMVEPIACIAAQLVNRPVKYVYSRAEEMQVSSPRAAERIRVKDGVTNDGRILARQVTLFVDAGAYSRHSPYGTTKAAAHMPGPYTIPNVWVDAHCVYTNRTPSSAMRGFGVTIGDFALESQMDRVAKALGIDPLVFRFQNAYRDGDMKAHRKIVDGAALIEVMQRAADLVHHDLPAEYRAMSSLNEDRES